MPPSPPPSLPLTRDTPPAGPPDRSHAAARVALVLGLAALGLWTLHGFLPALVWAAILALALWPLYVRVARHLPAGPHDILRPALFTLAVALVVLVPLAVVAVQAAREVRDVLHFWREIERSGWPVPEIVSRLPFGAGAVTTWWRDTLGHPAGASEWLRHLDSSAFVGVGRSLGTQVAHRAMLFGFTLLTLFFLFRDGPALVGQGLTACRRLFGPRGERVARQMALSVHGTVNGLVLVGLGEGFLLGLVYFAAGAPHPVLLGTITALAAMIPFATLFAVGLAALLVAQAGSLAAAGAVVAAGLLVTFLADHLVRPALIGGAAGLPFLWVLLGILGGVESFGLLGLFLGPAVMAALVLLWRDYTQEEPGSAAPLVDARGDVLSRSGS
ncbi:AI-2E family transporter [Methylobacterium oryzisoli]|uniref:AI-2E family transporter n=1 Tax=Methylobacterium oryzisoli TaxID=3385502 RepID=UPI003891B131